MKQRWGLIVLVAVLSFTSGGWLLQRGVASGGNVYQQDQPPTLLHTASDTT